MINKSKTEALPFSKLEPYTPEECRRYVKAWSKSKESLETFCQTHHLDLPTFISCAKKYRAYGEEKPLENKSCVEKSFRPVQLHAEPGHGAINSPLRFEETLNVSITLPNQLKIDVTPITSFAMFQQLIKAVSTWN